MWLIRKVIGDGDPDCLLNRSYLRVSGSIPVPSAMVTFKELLIDEKSREQLRKALYDKGPNVVEYNGKKYKIVEVRRVNLPRS